MRHILSLLFLLALATPASAQTLRVTSNCDLYERADVASTRLAGLFPGNTATRIGTSGRWYQVRRNGQTGYAMAACFGEAGAEAARVTPAPRASTSTRSTAGRMYHVGPRGGCYYVSASGRRVNVSRSLCGLAPAARAAAPARSSRARRSRTSGSSGYITGPRGGCYYINRNGNKTYVAHSYCGR